MIAVSFDAVIFDFDGLIIDSETPIFRIWEEIYRDHGAELTMGAWQHALGTHNGFDPYAELAAMTGTRLSREEWAPRVSEEHWRRCESEPRSLPDESAPSMRFHFWLKSYLRTGIRASERWPRLL